ncbi:hypothetical protein PIB30_034384 [Stylosanthes scabra]|uniref:Flowering time control protein FCA n=1 Tax=Stylosanthes scabra TaxID=79078 RepID=A0ABU6XAV7_9FABA|nr:hypothetical protein [Stylosanthes scabra]
MVNFSGDPHSYSQPQTQDNNHFNHPNTNYNCHNPVNAFPNPNPIDSPASGFAPPNHSRPPRKRPWTSPDQADSGHVKVYVAPVPKTATEADVRLVFEGHGTIVEVVLLRDKRTGGRQGSCFVKYATLDEAEKAIKALSNKYTFPGEPSPVVVRYADRERERLGVRAFGRNLEKKDPSEEVVDKVFVSCINKEASKQEIEEIFSAYGNIEDVFLHSRGYAFVKFSNREMAMAAIKGLNNTFTMKGCDHPLIVRFADPKKPKTGDPRGNFLNGNANFGPFPQESTVWPVPNFGDPNTRGSIMPMAPHHSAIAHQQVSSHMQNWEPGANMIPQPFPIQQPHSQLTSMPLQCNQAPKMSSQPFYPEVQRQLHPTDLSVQNIEQQPSSQTPTQSVSNSNTVAGSTSPDVPTSPVDEDFPECDWSEHYCPDGHTYYYNCVTCESKWEKPEEYAIYERGSQKQQKHEDHKESQKLPEHENHKESQKPQEHEDHTDSQKLQQHNDHKDLQKLQEHDDHKDLQRLQEHEDPKDLERLQEHKDSKDLQRLQEHEDHKESQMQQEHEDHKESQMQQEHEDHKESQMQQERKDHEVSKKQQEYEDHKESQKQQVNEDNKESQKQQELEDHKEPQKQQVNEDNKESQKQQVNEDKEESQKQQVNEDHKESQQQQQVNEDNKEESQKQQVNDDNKESQQQQELEDHKESQKQQVNENHKESQKQQELEDYKEPQKQQENEDHKESQKQQELEDDSCLLSRLSLSASVQVSQSQKENNDQVPSEASLVEQV